MSFFYNFHSLEKTDFCLTLFQRSLIMSEQIRISNLRKKYPNGTEALKGIDLVIHKGEFFTLLGPNGAGKSTLIRIITTLLEADSGEVLINGLSPDKHIRSIQQMIGVASQENEIDPAERADRLLEFQGKLFGMKSLEARNRADELIDLFKLQSEREKKAGSLSGGNKRRLHCALALVHKPSVLFLDEPTVGMDPVARATFWEVITVMNKKEGVTVFLTTQYLEEADKHAEKMALIMNGTIHFSGSIYSFKQTFDHGEHTTLEDSYLKYVSSVS